MEDPVLVEVLRGDFVESVHRGAAIVVDADGRTVLAIGEVERPVFPRSTVKAMQALPLIETGAAGRFGFGPRELALSCASHLGEPEHAELAASMLARIGLSETALECGSHWPSSHKATINLAASGGAPNQLHNNCSGKHSGFLAVCTHCGMRHEGYVAFGHDFQKMVRETMTEVTGAPHEESNHAIDGCSIPTYAVPLRNLALGFARMATGNGLGPERAKAAQTLFAACMEHPHLVAGTGAVDTDVMRAGKGRLFVKTGAEGVYCGAIPHLGLGFALKCGDGAARGAEAAMAGLLLKLLGADDPAASELSSVANAPIKSRKGVEVGRLRLSGVFA